MANPLFDSAALTRQLAQLSSRPTVVDTINGLPTDPRPTPVEPTHFPWGPAIATAAGNLADAGTTYAALHRPGVEEKNPLLGQNPASIVGLKAALTVPEIWAEHELVKAGHPTLAKVLGYGTGAFGAAIAAHNRGVGKK